MRQAGPAEATMKNRNCWRRPRRTVLRRLDEATQPCPPRHPVGAQFCLWHLWLWGCLTVKPEVPLARQNPRGLTTWTPASPAGATSASTSRVGQPPWRYRNSRPSAGRNCWSRCSYTPLNWAWTSGLAPWPPPVDELAGNNDLVVAADGANFQMRITCANAFKPRLDTHANQYRWLGTGKAFEAFTFIVQEAEWGVMATHG